MPPGQSQTPRSEARAVPYRWLEAAVDEGVEAMANAAAYMDPAKQESITVHFQNEVIASIEVQNGNQILLSQGLQQHQTLGRQAALAILEKMGPAVALGQAFRVLQEPAVKTISITLAPAEPASLEERRDELHEAFKNMNVESYLRDLKPILRENKRSVSQWL